MKMAGRFIHTGGKNVNVVTIVIAVLLAAVISVVIRHIDRQNNSMEKVKRYADRRLSDFDRYFDARESTLSGTTADMETKQLQAVAAVNRLNAQIAESEHMLDGLAHDRAALAAIEEKIAGYESAIATLMDMTAKVEQNLEHLHTQKGSIERLDAQLARQSKMIASLEAHIPQLVAQFEQKNAEQLGQVRTALAADWQRDGAALEQNLAALKQQANDLLAAVEQSIAAAYGAAARKAESLEDTAFTHLSELAQKRSDDYRAAVETRSAELEKRLNARTVAVQNEIEKKLKDIFTTQTTAVSAAITKQIEKLSGALDASCKDIDSRIAATDGTYKNRIAELRADIGSSLADLQKIAEATQAAADENTRTLTALRDSCGEQFAAVEARFNTLYASAVSDAEQKEKSTLARFNETAARVLTGYQAEIQEKIDTLKAALTATLGEVTAEVNQSVQAAQVAVERLQTECTAAEKRADAVGPELAERVAAVNKEIERFGAASEEKLRDLAATIDGAVERLTAQCESRQTDALAAIDSQLAGYRKDMEYRLSRLETTGGDIDTFEKDVRYAMEQAESRVSSDFSAFATAQQQKYSELIAAFQTDSERLDADINALERRINEIKETALTNVQTTLSVFEEKFDHDLKTTGDKLNDDVTLWKNALEGKLSAYTNEYESERRTLEGKYTDDLKAKLTFLQEKNDEQAKRTAELLQTSEASMQAQIAGVKNMMNSFTEDIRAKISDSSDSADEFLKKAVEEYRTYLTVHVERMQHELNERLKTFEEAIANRQETSAATADAALSDFNTWKQHFKQQLDEAGDIFAGQLARFKESSDGRIAEMAKQLEKSFTDTADVLLQKTDALETRVDSLDQKADASLASYETQSNDIIARLQNMYETMLQDTESRVRAQLDDSSTTLNNLKEEIKKTAADSTAAQATFKLKIQNDADEMQSRMSEIAKEIQTIRSQMQVYERAEQMKAQLDERIAALEQDFSRIEEYTAAAADLSGKFATLNRMNGEINARIAEFENQKARVDGIEKDYDRMLQLTGSIDKKMQNLQTTSDDLLRIEVDVRKFQDSLTRISGSYERLEGNRKSLIVLYKILTRRLRTSKIWKIASKIVCGRRMRFPAKLKTCRQKLML